MTTKRATCSETIYGPRLFRFPCSKKATAERAGKPYCTFHDPERAKAREAKRIASKCYYRVVGRYCGRPAVEVDEIGYGVCERHTPQVLQAASSLRNAAPDLLATLKAVLDVVDDIWLTEQSLDFLSDRRFSLADWRDKAMAVVTKAEGREP